METLNEAPTQGSFVPLAEHQSATPASFYSGPPVCHYFSDRSKIVVLQDELENAPALRHLVIRSKEVGHANGSAAEGTSNGSTAEQTVVENVDIWVTSEYVARCRERMSANQVSASYFCTLTH